jgi:hypothetical protein
MNRSEINKWREQLARENANDVEYNRIMRALLDGLSEGQKTLKGQSQHEKLEVIERAIRENLRVKHDLEVILATNQGSNK